MKKLTVALIVFTALFALVSCSSQADLCYYGFFSDQTVMLAYSSSKNTIYYVDLPHEKIVEWGENNKGNESYAKVVQAFCGLKANGIMKADNLQWQAFCEILDVMADAEPDNEKRLTTLVEKASVLGTEPLLSKLNSLLNADFGTLFSVLAQNQPQVCYLDSVEFTKGYDSDYCQKYMLSWIEQVL